MNLAQVLRESWAEYVRTHRPSQEELTRIKTAPDAVAVERRAQAEWASLPEPRLEGLTPAEYLAEKATVQQWAQLLIDWGTAAERDENLPEPLQDAVRSRLAELGPSLAGLIDDETLWDADSPGRGFAPVLAARLLSRMRYDGAVSPLLKALAKTKEFTLLGDAAVFALLEIGEHARPGLYDLAEQYKDDVESVPYTRAVEVLAGLPREDRTWHYLRRGLQQATDMVGLYISLAGDYGDQRAVYHLNQLLEERANLSDRDRQECLQSIELLGGIPTARARAAAEVESDEPFRPGKIGRNDPCPCGSGKKYKKCCGK